MHSLRLDPGDFSARLNDQDIPLAAVFPDLHRWDRLGVVVDSSIGLLGASLLIQSFAAAYLQLRRDAGELAPHYPEMYVFHVGGRYGDLRMLDILPERKEVFVANGAETLSAINQCGITRVAVPGKPRSAGNFHYWETGPAIDRVKTTYRYDVSGQVEAGELVLRGKGAMALDNLHCIGDIQHTLDIHGPVEEEQEIWEGTLKARAHEVTEVAAMQARQRWQRAVAEGGYSESFAVLSHAIDFLKYL